MSKWSVSLLERGYAASVYLGQNLIPDFNLIVELKLVKFAQKPWWSCAMITTRCSDFRRSQIPNSECTTKIHTTYASQGVGRIFQIYNFVRAGSMVKWL